MTNNSRTTPTAPLDSTFRATAHNAFERSHASSLSEVLAHVSSIEIDFWDDEDAVRGVGGRPREWFVRHMPLIGNDSNGRPPGDLRSCLLDVSDGLVANRTPQGIFVFLDKQQAWSYSRGPAYLDALLQEIFAERLFRPADLAGACSTPRDRIARDGWCTLAELTGRICFVLTGGKWGPLGDLDRPAANTVLSQYVDERRHESACFVAPHIEDPWENRKQAGRLQAQDRTLDRDVQQPQEQTRPIQGDS